MDFVPVLPPLVPETHWIRLFHLRTGSAPQTLASEMGSADKMAKCANFLLSAVLLTLVPSLAAAQSAVDQKRSSK